MMIDTLRTSKKLLENGFSPQQSEVLVDVIALHNEELATQRDISSLKKDIHAQISSLKKDIHAQGKDIHAQGKDIQELKTSVQELKATAQAQGKDIQVLREETQTSIQSLKESMEKSHSIILWILGLSIPSLIAATVAVLIFLLNTFIN
ncbi:MAG: hypothetical protein ACR2PY_05275 [Salinispira sp.]